MQSASSTARSHHLPRYPPPGPSQTPATKRKLSARIAARHILRGFIDGNRSDEAVQINHDAAAVRWLRDVSNGVAHLDITEPSRTPSRRPGDLGASSENVAQGLVGRPPHRSGPVLDGLLEAARRLGLRPGGPDV